MCLSLCIIMTENWTREKIKEEYENGRRDFSGKNFGGLDLNGINLTWTNMRGTNLEGANLTGANIDYSCWPLWCGSIGVKVDKKIAVQLCYHFCALYCDDLEYQEARAKVLDFANQMHRTDVKRLE